MITFTTLIPLQMNDGTRISDEQRDNIVRRLVEQFGPLTIEGTAVGFWQDNAAGKMRAEESLKVLIGCELHNASQIEPMLREIGNELGQEAMFLEIHAGGATYVPCRSTSVDQPNHGRK